MRRETTPRKLLKTFLIVFLLSLLLIAIPGCNKNTDNYVCITEFGKKYHKESCFYIKDKYKKLTLDDAEQAGYTACSKCW